MNLTKRLQEITARIEAMEHDLSVSQEQLTHFEHVADDAKTDALVAETPLADRQYQEASRDYERHRKYHLELANEIQSLKAELDRLLEQLAQS